jgi:Putative beta-barrel porin-2, OmpL-like. bbp2
MLKSSQVAQSELTRDLYKLFMNSLHQSYEVTSRIGAWGIGKPTLFGILPTQVVNDALCQRSRSRFDLPESLSMGKPMNQNQSGEHAPSPERPMASSQLQRLQRAFSSIGALGGLIGGFVCCLIGSLLTAFTWFGIGPQFAGMHAVGTVLLALTVPLIVLGAYSLDLQERLDGKTRTRFGGRRRRIFCVLAVAFAICPWSLHTANAQTPGVKEQGPEAGAMFQKKAELDAFAATSDAIPRASDASERKQMQFEKIEKLGQRLSELGNRSAVSAADTGAVEISSVPTETRPQVSRPLWHAYLPLDFGRSLIESRPTDEVLTEDPPKQQSKPEWQYGGFVDLGYLLDFNHPANRVFRSRGTTWHVDRLHLNMAGAYVKKKTSELSRWGAELTVHAGKDSEVFGFSATAPNIGGYRFLRHLGPTNVSYLAPVGKGLTLQAGIFGSLIGYDSLYAKDNFNYTRPWGADFTPYLMMGVNGSYPLSKKFTGTFFVVNGYWHLARANNVPSSGGQLAYKVSPRVTVKETVLLGPHQANTSFKFWRFLSDSLVERKGDRVTFAFEYIYSSERVDSPGNPRALMMASQFPVHWTLNKRWSVSLRPELFWDRDGRWTLARQTVKAVTTTLEYRIPKQWINTIFRLEHRYDDSRGPDGGFFRGAEIRPGVVDLTPSQHLLIFGLIFTVDR